MWIDSGFAGINVFVSAVVHLTKRRLFRRFSCYGEATKKREAAVVPLWRVRLMWEELTAEEAGLWGQKISFKKSDFYRHSDSDDAVQVTRPDSKSTSAAPTRVLTLVEAAQLYAQMYFGKLFIQNYLKFISVFLFDISIQPQLIFQSFIFVSLIRV